MFHVMLLDDDVAVPSVITNKQFITFSQNANAFRAGQEATDDDGE